MLTFYAFGHKGLELSSLEDCAELTRRSVWIDAVAPTREEELALESALGLEVPTQDEMQSIALSRRLYREKDTLFMTATVLTKSDTSHPESSAVTFILTPRHLVTVRYARPVAFRMFSAHWDSTPAEHDTSLKALAGLIDTAVERLADILESTAMGIDQLSLEVLGENGAPSSSGSDASPAKRDFKDMLRRIGRFSDLSSRAKESLVSLGRLLAFLRDELREKSDVRDVLSHLSTVSADLSSLGEHASFLSGKLSFLLDATLGLINNEQNAIIKIVSVAAVVFLPPTLVASIYGMNFHHMPELQWRAGYPGALALMVVSAVLPYLLFKRKGWL